MTKLSHARPALAGFAIASLFAAALIPQLASAQNQNWNSNPFGPYSYTVGVSGAITSLDTDFLGTGSASGSAGAFCLDGTADFWSSSLRYAGEFAGFRVAAAGSLCQGFGTASDPVGGFEGRTSISTFVTGGGRVYAPFIFTGQQVAPYAGIGGVYANVKVEAFPFESNRSWRTGWYWEAGVTIPLTPQQPQKVLGAGTVQSIDQAAMALYLAYKHIDTGDQTLSGGARANVEFDMFLVGVQRRY